jgi:hypothetical protein
MIIKVKNKVITTVNIGNAAALKGKNGYIYFCMLETQS